MNMMSQEISVAGQPIDPADIAQEMQYHPADNVEQAWQAAARALAVREVLRRACRDQGLLSSDADEVAEEQAISQLLAQQIQTPEPDEASCRRYFDAHASRFRTPDQVRVRHILLAAAKDDFETREKAQKKAARMLRELSEKPHVFADLAARYSVCPSRENGGDLGWIEKGSTVPEFERQIERLSPDHGPMAIETRYGVHVVEVTERVEGIPLEYEAVREQVAGYLRQQAHHQAVHQLIALLMADYNVKGLDIDLPGSPLVQ